MLEVRHDWTVSEIQALFEEGLLDLVFKAAQIHRHFHPDKKVQLCTLLSVKTGGCPEDCGYCPQAARYHTGVQAHKLMPVDSVLEAARQAKASGSTRFCMGAAWREVKDGPDFDNILRMVEGIVELGMEACCTLGMLKQHQAQALAQAGLSAYNHNLDTSAEFYDKIITTRQQEDRLRTLQYVREAGITVCSGGIIGMGESLTDRVGLLHLLANLKPHPESVPINALVAVPGTPLGDQPPLPAFDFVRMIAVTRILMPQAMVRLSAGRLALSDEAQALCFLAGANSIFTGDKLLTTANPGYDHDLRLLDDLGLAARTN